MAKSIVTNYTDISAISASPAEAKHHLVFGSGFRGLADQDGLWIPLTNAEHNLSSKGTINQLHGNPIAESLSKMLGQMAYEKHYLAEKLSRVNEDGLDDMTVEEWSDEAREAFRKRYGVSYL